MIQERLKQEIIALSPEEKEEVKQLIESVPVTSPRGTLDVKAWLTEAAQLRAADKVRDPLTAVEIIRTIRDGQWD